MSTNTATRIEHSWACSMTNCYCTRTSLCLVHCYCHLYPECHLKMILEGNCIGSLTPSLLLLYQQICYNSQQSFITYLDRMTQSVDYLLFKALMDMTLGTSILLDIGVSIVYLLHFQLNWRSSHLGISLSSLLHWLLNLEDSSFILNWLVFSIEVFIIHQVTKD